MPIANNHSLFLSSWAAKFESLDLRPLYSKDHSFLNHVYTNCCKRTWRFLSNFVPVSRRKPLTGRLKMSSLTYNSAVSGYLWDKKEVQCSPVVMQQGGQDSHHFRDMVWTSLGTDKEEGKKGQTTSSSSLAPNLWFVGLHLQGKNSQCNS